MKAGSLNLRSTPCRQTVYNTRVQTRFTCLLRFKFGLILLDVLRDYKQAKLGCTEEQHGEDVIPRIVKVFDDAAD